MTWQWLDTVAIGGWMDSRFYILEREIKRDDYEIYEKNFVFEIER